VNSDLVSRVLYQSAACIVVNKLKGEAVEGAKKGMTDLPRLLSTMLGEKAELAEAVNRLDVPVTGCALFALDKKSLAVRLPWKNSTGPFWKSRSLSCLKAESLFTG